MCVPILRSIGTKLTKLENMQKSRFIWFIWRHVTQTPYVMRHGDYDTSDRYFDKEHFETNQKSLRFRIDVMWRKNATSCVMGTSTLLIDILTRNILKPTRSLYDFRFRSYGSNSGFRVFGDLDLDLWHMFFFLSHALRMMYWNIYAKFH